MAVRNTGKINSALALTKTQVIQNYHVFAYITANDISTSTEENPIYGSIIILASFSDSSSDGEMMSGKKQAIQYAKDMVSASGYDLIFWTQTHKWFNLQRRPRVSEVYYIDDKSGLDDATNYMNLNMLKRAKDEKTNLEESVEEERKLYRAQCNPDHVEHFITNIVRLSEALTAITDAEKQLQNAQQLRRECVDNLKLHYIKHPNHEEDALAILKNRLSTENFLPLAFNYTKVKNEVANDEDRRKIASKIYEKKSSSLASSSNSRASEKGSVSDKVSDRSRKDDQESGTDRSYSDVASAGPDNWTPVKGSRRRKVRKA